MIIPDYEGKNLCRVGPGIWNREAWLPKPVQDAQSVVVLLIDGLGWDQVSRIPALSGFVGGPITTVCPSTTASALTSFVLSQPPTVHGIVGYRIRYETQVLNILKWNIDDGSQPPEPETIQRQNAFGGRTIPVVTKDEFRNSGFTRAHLNGIPFFGWSTPAGLVERIKTCVHEHNLVYAYYDGIDAVSHVFGLDSDAMEREFDDVSRTISRVLDVLPSHSTLVVTADHGHAPIHEWVSLDSVAGDVSMYFGDGRFRWLATREPERVAEKLQRELGDVACVITRDELIEKGWMGPKPSATVLRRLGNVVVIAQNGVAFVDPSHPGECALKTGHGGLTKTEMEIPLIASP